MTTFNQASMVVLTTRFRASEQNHEGNVKKAFGEVVNLTNDVKLIAADGETLETNRLQTTSQDWQPEEQKMSADSKHDLVPDEVWLRLLRHLDAFNITQFGATSHRFNAITKDQSLWGKLDLDVANINANVHSIKAIIDVASKLKQLKINNRKEEKVDDAVVASLILKAKDFLKELILGDEIRLKNKAVVRFGCLSELESLELRSDAITATGLKAISKLRNLKKLEIPGNSYGDRHSIEEELNNLFTDRPNLHHLNLSSWCLTDENLKNIVENCFNLKHLNLERCVVYNDDGLDRLDAVAQLRNLQYLNLSQTTLSNESVQNIARNCTKLVHLNISGCIGLRDDGLLALSENCLKLRHLNLMGCKQVSREGFAAIFNFKKLNHLDVSHNGMKIIDNTLHIISKNCPELDHLDLSCSVGIGDDGVKALAKYSPNLKHLNLCCCYGVKEEGIKALASQCLELQHLNLSHLPDVLDCFSAIACLKKLQYLNLSNSRVTDKDIINISNNCTQLRYLNLSGSFDVSSDSLKALADNCVHLQHLNLKGFQVWTNEHFKVICSFKMLLYLDISGRTMINESVLNCIAKNCHDLRNLKVTIPFSGPISRRKRLGKQLQDNLKKKHRHLVVDIEL